MGELRAPWRNVQGAALANRRHPTCAKAGKEGRGSGHRALLTDLATGLLRLPRVHALRAPRGAPPKSGARRLWRELECARGGRGDSKVGGRKNITALTPRAEARSVPGGRSKARARRPGATCPPAACRPLPTWPERPAAWRRREVRGHAAAASPHPVSAPARRLYFCSPSRKLRNREKV